MIDRNAVKEHFNKIADRYDQFKERNSHYYSELKKIIREKVSDTCAEKVLEIGCGTGNLLTIIPSKFALGGDISIEMIRLALQKITESKSVKFIVMTAEELPFKPVFDVILAVDLMEHTAAPEKVLQEIRLVSKPHTKILVISANPIWAPILHIAEKKRLKMAEGPHHWPTLRMLKKAGIKNGFEIIECGFRFLLPFPAGRPGNWINSVSARIPVINRLGLIQYLLLTVRDV